MILHEAVRRVHTDAVRVAGDDESNIEAYNELNDTIALNIDSIKIEYEKLVKERLSLAYRHKRASEYPSFAEQLDTLYHGGYDAWREVIKAVKDKYPKPESD